MGEHCNGYRRADGTLGHGGYCSTHGFHCPLCGNSEVGHDQATCDEKMRNWRPTGLSQFFVEGDGSRG